MILEGTQEHINIRILRSSSDKGEFQKPCFVGSSWLYSIYKI